MKAAGAAKPSRAAIAREDVALSLRRRSISIPIASNG
jgi:hypothetical protein